MKRVFATSWASVSVGLCNCGLELFSSSIISMSSFQEGGPQGVVAKGEVY